MIYSIRSKFTVTIALVSVGVLVVFGFLLNYEFENYLQRRLLAQLDTECSAVAGLVSDAVRQGRTLSEVRQTLNTISSASSIRVTLIDSSGRVLHESALSDSATAFMDNHLDRPEVQEALRSGVGHHLRFSTTLNLDMLYVAKAIDTGMSKGPVLKGLRVVRCGLPAMEIRELAAEIRWKIFVMGGVVGLVIILVSSLVARRIADPVLEIASIIKDLRAGQLDRQLPVRSRDEIGRLAELINELTATLRNDIERLKKLERFRSEFLGNVSHELRTPIFSVKGFLETLLDGALDDPSVNRSFVEKAYKHASRLDALLTDLIEISRIESGEMRMSFRPFDVAPFLRQVASDYSDLAQQKQQTISVVTPREDVTIKADKDRLKQAIGTLIDNAVKYSQKGATITVRANAQQEGVRFEVEDNGPGIAPEHLPRVFERFYRVDKNRSREVGGTGLGLAIAKHIVEAHGSRLSVRSEVGTGTVFSFLLPT